MKQITPILLAVALAWPAGPALAMCGGNIFATCAPGQGKAHKLGRGRHAKNPPARSGVRKRAG